MSRDRYEQQGVDTVLSPIDELPGPAPALSEVQLSAQASDITTRFRRERSALSPATAAERAVLQPLDDAPGPAATRSDLHAHAMADAISTQMAARRLGVEPTDAQPGPAPVLDAQQTSAVARRLLSRRRRRMVWQSAAASLLVATLGGAAFAAVQGWMAPPDEKPSAGADAASTRDSPTAPATTPPPEEPKPQPQAARGEQREQTHPSSSPSESEQPAPTEASPRAERVSPAKRLLHRANRARARQRWQQAERLYVRVAREHTRLNEAYAATVAAASLRLEHTGDPEGALQFYRQALRMRPHGALSEQARYGVAAALRALGRTDAERRALRDFLDRYPNSLMKGSIRTRLESLTAGR